MGSSRTGSRSHGRARSTVERPGCPGPVSPTVAPYAERQRFVVPIYQRTYAWTVREQLEALFTQLAEKAEERLAGGKASFSHYMGALLVIPDAEPVFGRIQTFNVVDGQQRLTTFHLLYAALRDLAREYGFEHIARQITDLLLHHDQVPMQDPTNERYKLQPTRYDRTLIRSSLATTSSAASGCRVSRLP